MLDRIDAYARLTRIDRPIGNFLLLWPMLWALWLAAEGPPRPLVLGVFVAGVVVMRAAGCVINDFADRNFDGHVKRTVSRPMATGRVSAKEALTLFVVLCLVAFALVLLMNALTIWLSLVAVALAATYPFMKRYTYLPQVHLGAAFGWAVPMAFAAELDSVPPLAWLVFIAAVVWATVYDTMYAMVDRDDDLKVGIKSTAVLFGDQDRPIIGILQALLTLILIVIGVRAQMGAYYFVSLGAATLCFVYQQYLIRDRDRESCFRGFMNNNIYGGIVFLGIVLHYTYGAG
ncbi:4-hydroxybenzoate octaprenyltransferase [Ectothiorhodospiraceae bacterium WFHF3C12]|nr:4-hydroxybenzoate octaprenyltransferase [Ectothiorhodospiraceae bacterium WFHF3C12]